MTKALPSPLILLAEGPDSCVAFVIRCGIELPSQEDLKRLIESKVEEALPPEPVQFSVEPISPEAALLILRPENGLPLDPFTVHAIGCRLGILLTQSAPEEARWQVVPIGRVPDMREKTGRLAELDSMLQTLLSHTIRVQFQAIVSLRTGTAFGYEALIRLPQEGNIRRAGLMFGAAEQARLVSWFDLACQETCFATAAREKLREHLFINMDAAGLSHLADAGVSLVDVAKRAGIDPDRVVVEITERQSVEDFPQLIDYIKWIRAQGFKIAVDDAGSGYSSLAAIELLQPEFVKIERPMAKDLAYSGSQRALLKLFTEFSRNVGAEVIVEGIETRDQLAIAIECGAGYGQGYLLSRPKDEFHGIRRVIREAVQLYRDRAFGGAEARTGLSAIVREGVTASAEATVQEVLALFKRNPLQTQVLLLSQEQAVGIVRADELRAQPESALDSPALNFAHRTFPVLDVHSTLAQAAQWSAAVRGVQSECEFAITDEGRFAGVVRLGELLEALAASVQDSELSTQTRKAA